MYDVIIVGGRCAEYRQNLSAARIDPIPTEMLKIREAVGSNPPEATRLSMARAGTIDPREFFNPANLQRLAGSAG